jgi:hypothetical protein
MNDYWIGFVAGFLVCLWGLHGMDLVHWFRGFEERMSKR